MRLLVVEDDPELVSYVRSDLMRAGFAVDVSDNGVDAEHLGNTEPYDAIVLDLGLPQKPGMEVLQAWRQAGNRVPVIVLTARDAWYERVDGFKAGADDYLGKPFHVEELIARIRALIYRRHGRSSHKIETRSLRLDEDVQQVEVGEVTHQLTGTEFRLLRYMMLNSGRILSKTHLSEHVYDQDSERDSNLIEVYIRRLREKIGNQMILTKRGQGYIFNDPSV
ncbi:response regulator transcription factor [Granulosicoccus antarcticus]|uniref:Transcriptional regulatory protein QseB n=1 Tax=Granulosicoccus antarcticus IMCC3135 TaxID=1192854 RepID=A0A2Z2NP38_9GAMM|nr:response regulator transcription factor [Granulosicoccus antarcticus]ASJ72295.1 Transcriptional regulatory protein QseB [Granulosicoccus antarcticus IMCC3135]